MAADEVEICNLALAKLGGGSDTLTITAMGDGSKTSDLCELLYDLIRKEVLKRMKPQECTEYKELDESDDTPEMAEWDYVCDLPDDCLQFIRQTDEQYHKITYDTEVKGDYLFTNTYSNEDGDAVYVEYIVDEDTVTVFSDEVVMAIATKLAAELAPRIIGGEWAWKRRLDLLDEYEKLVMPLAKGINRQQQHHDERPRESKYEILGDRYEYS